MLHKDGSDFVRDGRFVGLCGVAEEGSSHIRTMLRGVARDLTHTQY
jgi:hypothetical protein